MTQNNGPMPLLRSQLLYTSQCKSPITTGKKDDIVKSLCGP